MGVGISDLNGEVTVLQGVTSHSLDGGMQFETEQV